ncbi:roadblock/LC7 domain-containing protein [Pseudonocardia xinjiangensis]|jgi:predicted regulator of Ras-like GTPase activity (Roadblock/LC7/MglB family)|uniref:Roadblock/LC7 domain-containing protein n=1 Tax=Pseudonocardia xinjiangensis TaxID=75289 RepID=A0ABX1RG49_9PSEU|nr:roadblock/LC7 domain-containing protein [Pseudonocardia xinjiangensis]NMH78080.1 roadblock/LC7 domain-containing protein [Pseudonocardia xinjiangensis]
MNGHGNVTSDLSWLLDDVVNSVVGALSAVVLSADGLQIGKSAGVSKDDSDQLSAIASSLQSLAKGVSRQFSRGDVVQNMIEMERGYLFVLAAGRGACLALLADDRVDVVAVAYEMNRLVKRVGDYLAAAPRNPGQLLSEAP